MQLAGACRQAKAVISVMQDLSIAPQSERPPTRLLVTMAMAREPALCGCGCPVAAMLCAVSALLHAQLVLTTDSATMLVLLMVTPAWQRFIHRQ